MPGDSPPAGCSLAIPPFGAFWGPKEFCGSPRRSRQGCRRSLTGVRQGDKTQSGGGLGPAKPCLLLSSEAIHPYEYRPEPLKNVKKFSIGGYLWWGPPLQISTYLPQSPDRSPRSHRQYAPPPGLPEVCDISGSEGVRSDGPRPLPPKRRRSGPARPR